MNEKKKITMLYNLNESFVGDSILLVLGNCDKYKIKNKQNINCLKTIYFYFISEIEFDFFFLFYFSFRMHDFSLFWFSPFVLFGCLEASLIGIVFMKCTVFRYDNWKKKKKNNFAVWICIKWYKIYFDDVIMKQNPKYGQRRKLDAFLRCFLLLSWSIQIKYIR